jgi:hypothetical protein
MCILRSNILILLSVINISISAQPVVRAEKLKRSDCFFGVHFDLHASEDIIDAGKTLTYAMVDTFLLKVKPDFIQIDCKGHPGISSYPTEVGFHVKGFEKDPLKLYREVTDKNNVALFMHFSGVWDGKVVKEHPEWAIIKANGERSTQKTSFFSPYLEAYMIPQLTELSQKYKVDGAWIDGECWAVEPDYCVASLKRFASETGITEIPRKTGDKYYPEFMEFTRELFREHLKKYVDAIHKINPGFQITSNWSYSSMMPEKVNINLDYLSGDVTPQNGVYRSAFEARCLAPQGKPWDLMAWGFSWNGGEMPMSIKSALQLKQEAAEIISIGGGVQFYFQQNTDLSIKPWITGMLEDIGNFCRERQKFCHKAVPVHQIALLYPSTAYQRSSPVPYSRSLEMLQGALYSILDGQNAVEILMEHNLTGKMDDYPLIIVPECDYLDKSLTDEIREYVRNGGNLLIMGPEASLLFREELGIVSVDKSPVDEAFITAAGKIGSVRSEILKTNLSDNAIPVSLFYEGSDFRFPTTYPAASVRTFGKGKIAAIYFNSGTSYKEYKTFAVRDFVNELINSLIPDKMVSVTGSHLVHIAVNSLNNKLYVSLINVSGEHSNENAIGYDEIPVIKDLSVSVQVPSKPARIILQPENKPLEYKYKDGRVKLTIPELILNSILEIE